GWLYRPDAEACGIGAVIVPPFGYEALCAHRALRHLARDAAGAGFIAVRFDLDGSGDSAGDEADPDRIEAWQDSIHDACDLARGAGAEQLVLVGVRLGATLAALAAPRRKDIAALIAVDAVVRGRDFLREAHALQAAMGLRPPPRPEADDGSREVHGYFVSADTRAQLQAIDLTRSTEPPAPAVLLIERDDLPPRDGWSEQLRRLGAALTVQRLPGLVEMLDAPHLAAVPEKVLGACIERLRQTAAHSRAQPGPRTRAALRPEARIRVGDSTGCERAVRIDAALFAILSHPAAAAPSAGVVLLNSGSIPHTGPDRMYVDWARRWAAHGMQVLRADLSGLGDSATRPGADENRVYGKHGIADTACIAAWLRQRGTQRIVAGGACSGAYHALRAAISGDAIDSVLLINPGALQNVGVLDNLATQQVNSYYNNQLLGGRGWHRLANGKASPDKLARVAGWYASTYGGMFGHELLRRLRWPLRNDLGMELQALADRGVDLHFVFSADDHSRARLAAQAGSAAKRLLRQNRMHTRIIDGPDHGFTQRWGQRLLGKTLDEWLIPAGKKQR
ncbi:MAG: alpha/beta hydrolase, partial [Gammaproteobacteria bacterium]|nr:alpha/beta hydrolase [Gammaproteobacteria bacterium]